MIEFLLGLGVTIVISIISYYVIRRVLRTHEEEMENLRIEMTHKAAKSLKRSKEVLTGQAAEQIVPYLEDFDYYPGDCRFLGSPIDMVIFNGAVKDKIDKIVLMEVKTGKSRLNKRQQQIKEAVLAGRVFWEEFRVKTKPIVLKHKEALAQIDECLCYECITKEL